MEQEQILRDYRISDSELVGFTEQLCGYITRDIIEFTNFGVTATNVTALKALNEVFEYYPLDAVYKQEVIVAIQTKDYCRTEVQKIVRSMALRVELKWGKNSAQYKQFEIADISKLGDDAYISRARGIYTHMNTHKLDYTAEGLTTEMLTQMETMTDALAKAVYDANEMLTERKLKSIERAQKGNEIYGLVSRYCEIGKRIWDGVNPAKFDNYVIYGASAGPLKPPVMIGYRPGDFVVSWGIVANATSYELQYSSDAASWTEAYSGGDDAVQYIPAVEGWAYFRCRARNSNGYGEFSEVLKAGYYQQIPPPSNVKAKIKEHTENGLLLTWDDVPSAIVYKVYTSVVAIGAASNTYELLGKPKVNTLSAEVQRGKRHYFQLTAENTAQWSQRSEAIYIDVE